MANEPSSGLDWIASITNVAPTAATTLTMAALIGAAGLASSHRHLPFLIADTPHSPLCHRVRRRGATATARRGR
jgi:hypothetical protein